MALRDLLLASLLLPACGNDRTSTDRDAGSDAGDPGVDAGADAGATCAAQIIEAVTGEILDRDGAPIDGATVGLCVRYLQGGFEFFVCLQAVPADAAGRYRVDLPEQIRCVDRATVRLLGPGHATLYCRFDVEGRPGVVEAPSFRMFPVPDVAPAWGEGDDEVAALADDGAEVRLRPSDVPAPAVPEDVRFGAIDFSTERPCFLPPDRDPASLYAMEPEGLIAREGGLPARLRAELPAGTAVDFHALGSKNPLFVEGELVEEGHFEPFAEGVVDADGFVETPDGAGLPQLGWFGVFAR